MTHLLLSVNRFWRTMAYSIGLNSIGMLIMWLYGSMTLREIGMVLYFSVMLFVPFAFIVFGEARDRHAAAANRPTAREQARKPQRVSGEL